MTVRLFTGEDYATVCAWWETRGIAPPHPSILPATGYLAEDASGPCLALWCYMDNSRGVALPEWLVSRPGIGAAGVTAGRALWSVLSAFLRSQGYTAVLFHAAPELVPVLRRLGMREGRQSVSYALSV